MDIKALKKTAADMRRSIGREHGFRQSAYINFKVDGGYFFCLYFFANGSAFPNEAKLTVKPMYADTLWWEIWDSLECIDAPISLRGTGAYALSGMVLAKYENLIDPKESGDSEMKDLYEHIFSQADTEISRFISNNPDADTFYPDETKMDYDPDRLLYLMALIHNKHEDEALLIIKEARSNKHHCVFRSGWNSDSYTYIKRWCNRGQACGRIINWVERKLNSIKRTQPLSTLKKDISENKNNNKIFRRKPWYMRLPEWVYWVVTAPLWLPLSIYFFDLHDRTIYDTPYWVWFILPALFMIIGIGFICRSQFEIRKYIVALSFVFAMALGVGFLGTNVCIGVFDGLNRLFADRNVTIVRGVVTNDKYRLNLGRGQSRRITIVDLPEEGRSIKIVDGRLFEMPSKSNVDIAYRNGLFGVEIIENITYE